jgi:hypothetical protein
MIRGVGRNGNGNGTLNCCNSDADLTVCIPAPKRPSRLPVVEWASLLYSYGPRRAGVVAALIPSQHRDLDGQ